MTVQAHYDPLTQDAALISALQKVKHYEIACYGTLKAFAGHLKLDKIELTVSHVQF
jgi:ferritin-like metal-binding protein YciE